MKYRLSKEQQKTNLNIQHTGTSGGHFQKDVTSEAIRTLITPFPIRLWYGHCHWWIVTGKNQIWPHVECFPLTIASCWSVCYRDAVHT